MIRDLDPSNLERIPIEEVPPSKSQASEAVWKKVFESVPEGMAFVIKRETRNPSTVKNALKKFHDKNEFLHLIVRSKGDKAFVFHSSGGKD